MKKYLKQLHWQIFIAMLLGVSLSFLLPPNNKVDINEAFILEEQNEGSILIDIEGIVINVNDYVKQLEYYGFFTKCHDDHFNRDHALKFIINPDFDYQELPEILLDLKNQALLRKASLLEEIEKNQLQIDEIGDEIIEMKTVQNPNLLLVREHHEYEWFIHENQKFRKTITKIDLFIDQLNSVVGKIVKVEYEINNFKREKVLDGLVLKDNWKAIYNSDDQILTLKAEKGYIDSFHRKNLKYDKMNIYVEANSFNQYIYMLGEIFIKLLKMMIIPLIITSIIVGVTNINDKATIGRLGRKTFGYYLLTSIIAIITGLALANLLRPGDSFPLQDLTISDFSEKTKSVKDLIMSFIMNPIQAAATGKTLPSIFFAILLGISINYLPKDLNKSAVSFFDAMYRSVLRITTWIIKLAPIGVCALIFKTLNTSGVELLKSVLIYSMTLVAGLSIHLLITLPVIFYLFTKINPLIHYKAILPAMFTAFSTSSSSATLPVTMNCSTKNAGVSKNVSGFVLPLGSTVNMDGTALFECAGVLFISQILGVNLDLSAQLTVVMIAFLASVGAAGVPHAGLVMIFIVLDAVGLSSNPQVPLIVATMFAIDRPLDMMRTMVNVTSDTVGASVIAKSEGENLYSKES